MKLSRTIAVATVGIILSLGLGSVASSATSPLADRQAAMKQIGAAMKEASGYASGQTPFNAVKVKAAMGNVSSAATKLHKLFPASTTVDPKSATDPKVWQNKADFDKRLTELATLAKTAGKTTSAETLKPAMGAVGATCKSCHDLYRMKKPA